MKRENAQNNVQFFLESIGKCYINGINLNPLGIYPMVEFPVPRGTDMLSPLISWDHSQTWDLPNPDSFLSGSSGQQPETVFEVFPDAEGKDHYLTGHVIDGHPLYPAAGYIVMVWRALAKYRGLLHTEMTVMMENIQIHRATLLYSSGGLKFSVCIIPATGEFEIEEKGELVCSGSVYSSSDSLRVLDSFARTAPVSPSRRLEMELTSDDIYKVLRLRGYEYGGKFKGIVQADNTGERGEIKWTGDWISFIDAMMQITLLSRPGSSLQLPTKISEIAINPDTHNTRLWQWRKDEKGASFGVQYIYIIRRCAEKKNHNPTTAFMD